MSGAHSLPLRLLVVVILALCCALAFAVRLFSVLKYEAVIHEFDPYFNYRSTQAALRMGLQEFYNWFDDMVWYPLGRHVGHTVYPGLMITAAAADAALRALHFVVEPRLICVLMGPMFAALTSLVTYFLGKELWSPGAGLFSAALIAVAPGYISRSTAGGYDNECVAIFAMLVVLLGFVKAVNSGSLLWSMVGSLGYFYMVTAWGGYIYVVNLLPAYTYALVALGRYSHRLYVAYSTFYVFGVVLAMQVPFVGFQAVHGAAHFSSHAVFALLQLTALVKFVKGCASSPLLSLWKIPHGSGCHFVNPT
eukprot:RCo008972